MADWKQDVIETIPPIATTVGNEFVKDPSKVLAVAGAALPFVAPIAAGAAIGAGICWIADKLGERFL